MKFNLSDTIPVSKGQNLTGTVDGVVSEQLMLIFQWVNYAIICQIIDIVGTFTNIGNIVCFVKQGFRDSVNVSLFGLAISDLGCLLTNIWTNICCTPTFSSLDLPFIAIDFQYLTSAWPHVTFTRISSLVTAFITIERCLCITSPLKVKNIFTPKRVSIVIISIYIILIGSVAPVYVVNKLGMIYVPHLNKSLIGLIFAENREAVEKVSFAVNNIFVHFGSFVIIIACTVILVIKLRDKTKWRNQSSAHAQAEIISKRNRKACQMVATISTVFIICVIPVTMTFLAMIIEPEISPEGKYRNIVIIIGGLSFLMESINSSVNIIVYYYMSSKFRSTLLQIFHGVKGIP